MAVVALEGSVYTAPELRTIARRGASGESSVVVNLLLAVRDRYQDKGKWTDGPIIYYDVAVFGDAAARVNELVKKGDRLVVAGELTVRSRRGASEGDQDINFHVQAAHVGFSTRFMEADFLGRNVTPSQKINTDAGTNF